MAIGLKRIDEEIFRNIKDYFLALSPAPINNEHVTAWFTGQPHPLMNIVLSTRLSENNVQEWIENILFRARANQFPISWWVSPFTTPLVLEEKLKENGFAFVGHFPAMAQDLRQKNPSEIVTFPDLRIRRILKRIEANPWGDIVGGAFSGNPEAMQKYLDLAFKDGKEPHDPLEHYLGFVKEKPITAGTLFLDKKTGMAGIYNLATPEETRMQGYASQMVLFLLERAKALGYDTAVLLSSPMAGRFYSKMGFRQYFNISFYAHS